jgi:phosphomevalonate kinase
LYFHFDFTTKKKNIKKYEVRTNKSEKESKTHMRATRRNLHQIKTKIFPKSLCLKVKSSQKSRQKSPWGLTKIIPSTGVKWPPWSEIAHSENID